MPDVRDISFELARFSWTPPDRLEVTGRWSGLEGRRLGRPALTLAIGDERRRLTALPGGQLRSTGEWRATFAYDGEPEAIDSAELEVGRRLLVELPPPRRRRERPDDTAFAEERRRREAAEATLAEREAEIIGLRDEAETAIAERESEIEKLRETLAAAEAERGALQLEAAQLRGDLVAREQELAAAREEAEAARDDAEQRLAAERAAATELREKLATAREEVETSIAGEAQETGRLRAELEAAREETERLVAAERAETARLREELATRSATNGDDGGEAEAAARRMYERIARELEHERAAARHLRRELDAVQAQTAEHRRIVSSAAANGVSITDEGPAAATPAGRLAATRRTEAGRAAAHQRAEAARAAAAHRVPTHRSAAAVWVTRGIAVVAVVALLIVLLILVSALT
jgi:regulator of replication initiation timing